ncbi:hypothetical protein A3C23_01400 [Candidatus Roizmanbacteria bacterium RIFCSPHIGHO2_02_FULL_37_13b]|uniref:ChsH2 C-terminal OB-fold domain-containing protein n=1 Tax=Candidatus Roizmanbacteria bacterium RIFCSPLOWO2_02_FULL_36_11 TaxID=1802071 RepID=A0A1F7JC66_9BACT|nr:MAG: hypothetical protein A3C23_01400 [Candidatus Roizmanbacteria bacterium RIFCSPHIGHO2_02_FULL_37_13b]OGK53200.1 MAG: hypothetical protein A3H78_02590 [Candidatus Roizmanbacteria bacterium RIFCSPLOWO2_02_FULL_36_11]
MISPVKIWRRQRHIKDQLGKTGKILTWTKIYIAAKEFKKNAPYYVVMVELDSGRRLYGQLVDLMDEKISIGMKVESILRKVRQPSQDGVIAYGIKFKLLKDE